MYDRQDSGHIRDIEMCDGDVDNVDAHAYPILLSLWRKGIKTRFSCGGHTCTRDEIEPIEIGFYLTVTELVQLAQRITDRVKEMQYVDSVKNTHKNFIALDRIVVVNYYSCPHIEIYPIREELLDYSETDGKCFYEYPEYYTTPELILEWNKLICVMQITAAIESFEMPVMLIDLVVENITIYDKPHILRENNYSIPTTSKRALEM